MSRLDDIIMQQCPNGVPFVLIKDVAVVGTGSSDRKEAVENGEYPFYVRSKDVLRSNKYLFDETAIVIPGEGGVGDIFHFVVGKYDLHQRAYRISFTDSRIDPKFAFYYFSNSFKKYIMKKSVEATVTSIRKPMIENFPIAVPPLSAQLEIAMILDNFTELTSELTSKLAREIVMRKNQYEYYRNKLLTFDER